MRTLNVLAFDEVVTGTGTTWYTPQALNSELGRCDIFGLQAYTTGVLGTSPTLTVSLQHSGDDQNWRVLSSSLPELNATSISSDTSRYAYRSDASPARFVRAAITLGGTNPQCRLKLFITGRSFGT